ncbi:citrulline utilization hydrolase CtlX [Ideonella livida]|nr:arginine deiminase-related protein [Ideonella livida]
MVRPHHFHPNPETLADNGFQSRGAPADGGALAARAFDEVSAAAQVLRDAGVTVHLFEDDGTRDTPDSVFPNNWFSTHPGGRVVLYPMHAASRRSERRADVIELLKARYRVQELIDYSGLEADGLSLEGTGAMVLDHLDRVAYVARSQRADPAVLARFAAHGHYEPLVFDATDAQGLPVYHTNVLMCVATRFALVGTGLIRCPAQRAQVVRRLQDSGREVIELSEAQLREFAGNALELSGRSGPVLALSARAAVALTAAQRAAIERSARLLPLAVPTIELAGGSVRCMLAGIHLTPRPVAAA